MSLAARRTAIDPGATSRQLESFMFKRILVAIDGSPASNAGLRSAAALAADQRATLLALHVVDDSAILTGFDSSNFPSSYVDAWVETLRTNGRKALTKAGAFARDQGVELQPVLAEARGQTVAHAIIQQARRLKADVIVLGTHGRRGLRRVLLGSDAEAVVREASVPVLLVRSADRATRQSSAAAKRNAPVARATRKSGTHAPNVNAAR
jgi:nucleotide-binding universal stress UspA family protein